MKGFREERQSGPVSSPVRLRQAHRNRLAIAIIASVGVGLTNAGYAGLIRPLVDKVILGGNRSGIWQVPAVVIGMALFKGAVRYLQEYCIRTTGQLAIQRLRNDLYRHIMRQSIRFFSKSSSGNLMSRVLNDINQMQRSVSTMLVDALRESISLVALTGVAFYQDWQLASLAFLAIPVTIVPGSIIGKRIKNYVMRGQQRLGQLTAVLQESLAGIKVIKALGREHQRAEIFGGENRRYYQLIRKTLKYDALSHPIVELLSCLAMAAVLSFGLHRILSGSISEGQLFSFIAAMMMMFTPVKKLTRVYNDLQKALGAAERVFEIMDQTPDIVDRPDAFELQRVSGAVEFDRVSFSYGESQILHNLSLRARPGEVIALVGPSGARKTTMAGLLNRFFDPDEGSIRIDGRDISRATLSSLKKTWLWSTRKPFCLTTRFARTFASATSMPAMPKFNRQPAWPAPRNSFASCRRATTPSSAIAAPGYPAASASGCASPAPSCAMPPCWCSTKQPAPWTRKARPWFSAPWPI